MVKKETKKKTTKKTAAKKKTVKAKKAPAKAKKEKPKEAKKPEMKEAKAETKKPEPKAKEEPKKPEALKEKAAPKEKKKKPKKAKKKKKATKAVVARGKRKRCVARATIKEGKGTVRLNSMKVSALNNGYVQEIITEPLRYVGPEVEKIDISVSVNGGGAMGQAQAARSAIARALLQYFPDLKLREKFSAIDRSLVVEDTRRVEPKKYRGPKARARYQKSYR